MKKNKNNDYFGTMYSTEFSFSNKNINPEQQELHLHIEKKGRGGKCVTIVRNFIGSDKELKDLGKQLKNICGVGGSTKNEEIILQGEVREKITKWLQEKGYKTKRIGG